MAPRRLAPRRRRRPATASRIIAAGVAVGTASGAVAFMAVSDPHVVVRTVAAPAPPAPPAKVIVLEVQHQPAPAGAASGAAPGVTGAAVAAATPARVSASPAAGAAAPAAAAPAATPAPAPPPAAAPAPVTKTGPS